MARLSDAEFLAQLAAGARMLAPITVVRRSRSGNKPHPHVMQFEPQMLTPIDLKHPCSCAAGSDGNSCWAVLEWLAYEAPKLSQHEGVLERARLARAVIEEREQKRKRRRKA
jgi:hypothetical protein